MNETIFQNALQTVSSRRIRAREENERRYDEINRRIPEIAEINHHLAQTATKILELVQEGESLEQRLEALKRRNLEAQTLSARLLEANGYPADYLDIRYTCEKCQDTGYSDGNYCDCLKKLIASFGIAKMNQNAQLRLSSFSQFSLDYYRGKTTEQGDDCYEIMQDILRACQRYASEFSPAHSPSLLFYGRTGLGKTHLSLAIASEVLQQGHEVIYDSVINLLQQVEREHFGRDKGETDTLSLLLGVDLLILDDLGTEFDTPFYVSTVYNIINTRLNRGLPTIINTNFDLQMIRRRYEERIVSRLFAVYECMHFVGSDIRLMKKIESGPRL
ncbi:MAG: ATP-binding protein [Oscillospiraceae bacterium]|nr:ATP-binding protein [Oscillospiraceae bacterium]